MSCAAYVKYKKEEADDTDWGKRKAIASVAEGSKKRKTAKDAGEQGLRQKETLLGVGVLQTCASFWLLQNSIEALHMHVLYLL